MNGWVEGFLLLFVIGGYYDLRRDLKRLSEQMDQTRGVLIEIRNLVQEFRGPRRLGQ